MRWLPHLSSRRNDGCTPPYDRPGSWKCHGTLAGTSRGPSSCIFLTPFALDVIPSILPLLISTLALPTCVAASLSLVIHAPKAAHAKGYQKKTNSDAAPPSSCLPTTPCGFITGNTVFGFVSFLPPFQFTLRVEHMSLVQAPNLPISNPALGLVKGGNLRPTHGPPLFPFVYPFSCVTDWRWTEPTLPPNFLPAINIPHHSGYSRMHLYPVTSNPLEAAAQTLARETHSLLTAWGIRDASSHPYYSRRNEIAEIFPSHDFPGCGGCISTTRITWKYSPTRKHSHKISRLWLVGGL